MTDLFDDLELDPDDYIGGLSDEIPYSPQPSTPIVSNSPKMESNFSQPSISASPRARLIDTANSSFSIVRLRGMSEKKSFCSTLKQVYFNSKSKNLLYISGQTYPQVYARMRNLFFKRKVLFSSTNM